MSKDQFDDLKKRLQEANDPSLTIEQLFYESGLKNPGLIEDQLKIMDSGIFHEGKLRGRNISGKYRTYTVNNIEDFVIVVALMIYELKSNTRHEEYYIIEQIYHIFKSSEYDNMITRLRTQFGIRKANKMQIIKKKFMALRNELVSEITKDNKKPIYNKVEPFFDQFKKYIPEAPDQTIADRISELLLIFDVEFKAKAILQRMRRARMRSTSK